MTLCDWEHLQSKIEYSTRTLMRIRLLCEIVLDLHSLGRYFFEKEANIFPRALFLRHSAIATKIPQL